MRYGFRTRISKLASSAFDRNGSLLRQGLPSPQIGTDSCLCLSIAGILSGQGVWQDSPGSAGNRLYHQRQADLPAWNQLLWGAGRAREDLEDRPGSDPAAWL